MWAKRCPTTSVDVERAEFTLQRILREMQDWSGHSPETIRAMREGLAELRRKGEAVILD